MSNPKNKTTLCPLTFKIDDDNDDNNGDNDYNDDDDVYSCNSVNF